MATDVDKIKDEAKDGARQVASSPWTERLVRMGYIVRGLVYLIPGILALQLAFGVGGEAVNQTGAIAWIAGAPFGDILLVLVAIGLLGFSIWGLVRAAFDPFRVGDDAEGLAKRFGYIASGLGYAILLIATVQYIMGYAMPSNGPEDWTAQLLTKPFGRVIIGLIGLGWLLGGGVWQILEGLKASFKKQLRIRKMSELEEKIAISMGRFGVVARGVVFGLIGLFLIQAAVWANPNNARGLDGALLELAQKPYGAVMLGIVALGLIAFGVFSMLSARWIKVNVPRHAR